MPTLVQRPSTGTPTKRRTVKRWKIALAVVAALLLHAALIVLLAWALPHWPRPPLRKGSAPIQWTVLPAEPSPTPDGLHKTEVVPNPSQPEYIRTPDILKTDTPPPDPSFISSEHTAAVSQDAAQDPFKPLPNQKGLDIPAFDFLTNPYIAGQEAHDTSSAAAPAESAPTPPPDARETPTPRPVAATPSPTPGEFLTLKPDATPSDSPPEPSATPTPRVANTPPPPTHRQTTPVQRNPTVASTAPQQAPGYQPQTTQTKMAGAIDNHGKISSVAALGTPLGRYQKAVEDAVGARWYFNVEENMSNLIRTGEVKIHFVVTRTGKIINTRIIGTNQNTALADISLEAVVNAEVPAIPADVAAMLPGGQLEGDLTFVLY